MPQGQVRTDPTNRFGAEQLCWLAPPRDGPEESVKVLATGGQSLEIERDITARPHCCPRHSPACSHRTDQPERIVTLGCDCLIDLAPMVYLNRRYEGKLGVL